MNRSRRKTVGALLSGLTMAIAVMSMGPAVSVALAGPAWRVDSLSNTTAAAGSTLNYVVEARNVGDASTDGSPITFTATLPDGITAVSGRVNQILHNPPTPCTAANGVDPMLGATSIACTGARDLARQATLQLNLTVAVAPSAAGTRTAEFGVSGGGAGPATTVDPVFVGDPFGFGVDAFDGSSDADASGTPFTQASGHPYTISTSIDFNTVRNPAPAIGDRWPVEAVRDVFVALPPGLVGNPAGLAECDLSALANGAGNIPMPLCPPSSQVGTTIIHWKTGFDKNVYGPLPVFNMAPPPDVPARFGFNIGGTMVVLDAQLRSGGDYGVTVASQHVSEALAIAGTKVTFWGVPADASHDLERSCPGEESPGMEGPSCTSGAPKTAFLRNPTSCTAPGVGLPTTLRMDSWQHPGVFQTASFTSHDPVGYPFPRSEWGDAQGPTGCAKVRFDPTLSAQPTSKIADAPSGLDVDLSIPQEAMSDPSAISQADLRKAVVTLPEGLTVNPSSADGLQACSLAQIDLDGENTDPDCPEASKIGTVRVDTPLLKDPLDGSVYLAAQGDNPFHSLLAMYVVAKGPGVVLKLAGHVDADPATGRLTTTFDDNPQLPFSKVSLRLKTGARAPLATPAACGSKVVEASLSSWAGRTVAETDPFSIGCPGSNGFAPSFAAGTVNPTAGAFSPFLVRISRPDGQENLDGVSVDLPPGSLAKLKGVTQCPEAQAATGTCGKGSQIGSATVAAGAGPNPFSLKAQPVYLGGPYKGAPFSLSVVTRAKAGPFDLGTVVVRQALRIDPIDAHATVVSDPLPTILQGIPLRIRSVDVAIDRPGFTLNPTSCAPKAVAGVLHSIAGSTAAVSARFQASDCASLALKPSLGLSLSGKGQTTDGKHPAVTASLTQPFGGQSNLKKVRVALPLSLALDPDNANGLCEFVDGTKAEPTCPKASIVGTATAVTPILDEPLSGPVYFVKNIRKDAKSGREIRTLPKLVIPLTGQNGLKLTLTGTSAVEDDQLVTTFDNIPDAPVSSFKLDIKGGKGGILTISGADICKITQIADQQIDGHNGKHANADVSIQTPSCPTRILSKKITAKAVILKVSGLGAGKVTVTGRGIKKTTKTIAKSTVATITAKRTKGKPGKVTVSYDPTGPAKARKTTK